MPYHVHIGEYSRTHALARLADIRQPVLLGLAEICELFCSDSPKFAKGYFS
jgi:hypothetical protein